MRFDVVDPAFIADPYPLLSELREATPIFFNEPTNQWVITRYADVHETLRDRRLGRVYTHRFSPPNLATPSPIRVGRRSRCTSGGRFYSSSRRITRGSGA